MLSPIVTETVAAAQAQSGNPEWVQVLILLSLIAAGAVALSSLLAAGALLPPDEPQEPTRADRVRGLLLLLVLEVQTAVAIVGAL